MTNSKKISLGEIVAGDVMLKTGITHASHVAIAVGQAITNWSGQGSSALTVHGAIYAGLGSVIESSGPGLLHQPISKAVWLVYRYSNADVASIALDVANTYYAMSRNAGNYTGQAKGNAPAFGAYSTTQAVSSLARPTNVSPSGERASKAIWEGGARESFYCSNFVVRCYEAAGQTASPPQRPINADYRSVSPKELQARLNGDPRWRLIGAYSA